MRWIKIALAAIAGLLALAAAVLLVLGRREGAGVNAYALEIARPPAEVFAWVEEPEKLKQWVGWLAEVRQVTPGAGEVRREIWVMDDPNMKKRIEMEGRIRHIDKPRTMDVDVILPGTFEGNTHYALTDLGGGRTRLAYTATFRYIPFLYRLIEPLVTPEAQKKLVADMTKIKTLAEAAPRN